MAVVTTLVSESVTTNGRREDAYSKFFPLTNPVEKNESRVKR